MTEGEQEKGRIILRAPRTWMKQEFPKNPKLTPSVKAQAQYRSRTVASYGGLPASRPNTTPFCPATIFLLSLLLAPVPSHYLVLVCTAQVLVLGP